ncbi:hypothetical protein D8674_030844 [Pyrus ussuriensis x Pyrus communis]|uniref:Uncharacterized protein n=1 Tax=Pyrus ussuriensis x Pyrus communis TaxID=2448454 RepID=A0A5N5FA20_9ROSA|nr:hypothetical protein D8674_030844 [Pyrus ussuriensis x Pyrus communis]
MSNLIRSRKAVMTAPRSIPPPPPSAATALAEMDHSPVDLVGPGVSQAPMSSASSVVLPVSAKRGHRRPCTPNTTSASTTNASGSQQGKQHSALAHDIGHVLFTEWYKQWKSDLHQYFETFDDSQVTLEEGCPKEFDDWEENWVWFCNHSQEPDYKKAKANKINWGKKTLLHHSGSRPFSYRMEAQRQGGSNFPEIDVFGYVYVQPKDELAESLHVNDDDGEKAVGSSGSQLPTSSQDSAQVCGSPRGCRVPDRYRDLRLDSQVEAEDVL